MNKRKIGSDAETYAVELLKIIGYKIIKRNYFTPFSEIDIIALKDKILFLIEVKARWGTKFGKPEEAVNKNKIYKIKKAGELFLLQNPKFPRSVRILVVSLLFENKNLVSKKIIEVY